jgi:hypothetical protein
MDGMVKMKCVYCAGTGNRVNPSYLLYGSGRKWDRQNRKKVKCFVCNGTGKQGNEPW